MKNQFLTAAIVLLFTISTYSQVHWECLLHTNVEWKYLEATSEPAAGWQLPSFDDSAWKVGRGGIGYGDDDDSTVVPVVKAIYLRTTFDVVHKDSIFQLLLDIDYDDAFVAYLNGKEVARSSNIDGEFPFFDAILGGVHEAVLYNGGQPERHILDTLDLLQGKNLLAVQVVNEGLGSTDLSSNIFLNAEVNSANLTYRETPSWFIEPVQFSTSNLPIIKITTNGQTIPDEPKITAIMEVINNGNAINSVDDVVKEYSGYIGIEKRGSSSQYFAKNNYSVETRTSTGENNNVSLLGMPPENDWVFHGPYSDKSLIRNALAYHLADVGRTWAPRTSFFELIIDEQYIGVYLLVEKIKRDSKRVDISKLTPDEISGDDITGGYILKVDRADDHWISPYPNMNDNGPVPISYVYPDYVDMPEVQRNYIKTYVTNFENALAGDNFESASTGYRAYANIQSFVDYFIVNELSKNIDAYRLSTFFHKNKESNDGRLVMGPVWDFNFSFGNANYYAGDNTQGWVMHGVSPNDYFAIPFWWERLRESIHFNALLKTTWNDLRKTKYSNESIHAYIDSVVTLLNDAQERNFQAYPVLGYYVWPNYFIGETYQEEIDFLKNWVDARLDWMDSQIALLSSTSEHANEIANAYEVYAFPNPFAEHLTLRIKLKQPVDLTIKVFNLLGQNVFIQEQYCFPGINDFNLTPELSRFESGIYMYEIHSGGITLGKGKIIKK